MADTQPYLAHLTGAFCAPVQAWSRPDGGMCEGAEGIYCGDERVVRSARLCATDHTLRHIATHMVSATEVRFVYVVTAPAELPDPLMTVERTRRVSAEGVDEWLEVATALDRVSSVSLDLALALDRTSMEVIKRGGKARGLTPDGRRWSWRDDDTTAELEVRDGIVGQRGDEVVLRWNVDVRRGAGATVGWSLRMMDAAAPVAGTTSEPLVTPPLRTADQRLHRLAARAFSDLNSLRIVDRSLPDQVFLAAGAPWFYTMFGRDSLIAARMLLPVDTRLAAGTLRALAARQGTRVDEESSEQPGKILHEVRRTTLTLDEGGGVHLPPVYYGTVDATPLWVTLLHDAWRAGLADDEVVPLLDNLKSALRWLVEHGDSDGDGFLEYLDTTGHGLANQGWKDSGDSIRWHDGSIADGPIALCEVQAYAYEAAIKGAALLEAFGCDDPARWRTWAADLKRRFREAFWCNDEHGRYPALALDAHKRPVDGLSSNIGHLLGTGILEADEQQVVVDRLLDATMFSGYGIRTLSTTNGGYWPLRYHAGSVWSHDTAIVIDGMLRDGFAEEAATVASGLLLAAEGFDYRLPELFGGHPASEAWPPVPYPASCRPQAWAAAAVVPIARALGAL